MFKVSQLFYENLNCQADIAINQGGTDSGKTYALIQLMFKLAITMNPNVQDPVITVLAESVPNLKKGAMRIAEKVRNDSPELQRYIKQWHKADSVITFHNDVKMEFVSCADEQSAKQGKRQFLFANEANGISWPIFWQMAKRTRQRVFIDYNPSAPFWAHEQLIGTDPSNNELSATVELIISDHRHNAFLSEQDHFRTENIKDPELWRVYARGLTGNISGIIFPEWQRLEDDRFDSLVEGHNYFGGLDFGYTNDPTAGVKIWRIGNDIYVKELCYTPGLSARTIKGIFEREGFSSDTPVYCEHDEDMGSQLRRLGMQGAIPAKKGAGSIKAGITKLKEFRVFYSASSTNLHNEKQRYLWLKNPKSGKLLNEPIDQFNHLMDAIRYGVYTHYFTGA